MPVLYEYKARDARDRIVSGEMEAASEGDLVAKLKKMDYHVTRISEIKIRRPRARESMAVKTGRVNQKEVLKFLIKLASMLEVGISLPGSIKTIRDQTKKQNLRIVLDNIYTNVSGGTSFSKGLSLFPGIFPNIMIRMVEIGEATGKLPEVLSQYAEYAENQAELRSRVKSALTYPVAVLSIAGIVVFVFLTFVIPRFLKIFQEMKIELPLPTQILVNLSNIARGYWLHGLIITILLIIGYKTGKRFYRFNSAIDKIKLKIPVISDLLRKAVQAQFAQTLGILYQTGVPILQSLSITSNTMGNIHYAKALDELYNHVKDGKRMSDYISGNPLFNPDIVEMVNVGEASGQLAEMLQKVAAYYRKEVDDAVKNATSLLEPIIICFMGGCVAFLGLSIILPIFKMTLAVE